MATKQVWEIEGLDKLIKNLGKAQEKALEILDKATEEGVKIVETDAKSHVPVVTGTLRDSIKIKLEKTSKNTKKAWQCRADKPYAARVEADTPFLRPALDSNKDKIIKKMSEIIADEVEKSL